MNLADVNYFLSFDFFVVLKKKIALGREKIRLNYLSLIKVSNYLLLVNFNLLQLSIKSDKKKKITYFKHNSFKTLKKQILNAKHPKVERILSSSQFPFFKPLISTSYFVTLFPINKKHEIT